VNIAFEYGAGLMEARLPDSTDVFLPGETVPDPPFLADVEEATRRSIRNPIGLPPLVESARPGMKVVIVFPDRVKGGFQETSHRKVALPLLIEDLQRAGVTQRDIRLICSNGLHRKNTPDEIRALVGERIFGAFWQSGQIGSHDSEDWDNLVDLGVDALGSRVIMNREVFEADFVIQVGHVLGNPYGGYSGGYKHCATGITHWKSIAAHHVPTVMHRADFLPANPHSRLRQKMDSIGRYMEARMGKPFFTCDAVLDTRQRQIAVFSGAADAIQPLSWEAANRRTVIPWAEKKYDVLVFGMPRTFQYGDGMGTNPILVLQAIAAQIIRHKRVLSDSGVVICSSLCNGFFNDETFPSYRALFERFQGDYHTILPGLEAYAEADCASAEWIRRYRFQYGYHPYHAYSMISCGQIAEQHTSAIYLVGAQAPELAQVMGLKTRATFEETLRDAQQEYLGANPNILALPGAFLRPGVHLDMKG
jgi:hypothetical protein